MDFCKRRKNLPGPPMQGHGMPLGWEEREGHSSPGASLHNSFSPLLSSVLHFQSQAAASLDYRVRLEPPEAVAFPRRLQGQRKSLISGANVFEKQDALRTP